MEKLLKSFLSLAFLVMFIPSNGINGQTRQQARHFLIRTHRVIAYAKEVVNEGKVYTGDLTRAVYHQRFARELFKEGKFERAIHHSYRARELAHAAIRANKKDVAKEMEFQDEEKGYIKNKPDNASLDVEIKVPNDHDDKVVIKEKEEDMKEQ